MELDQPFNGNPRRQFVPVDQDRSRQTHESDVDAQHNADHIVNVEQNAVEPKPLGLVNPLFPTTFRIVPFGREGRLVRRHGLKYSSVEQRRSLLVPSSHSVFGFGSRSRVSISAFAAFWRDRA